MRCSVIICTHNPRQDYLRSVLAALQEQTLTKEQWELLLIDNASKETLSGVWDLSWHPNSRHIREEALGLTPARLRGISEAKNEILIFLDDDNLPAPDYLQRTLEIAGEWPLLGAWGGSISPRFETKPPEWTRSFWGYLAIRETDGDYWSNDPENWKAHPWGAGLCIRRFVAQRYLEDLAKQPHRKSFDRKGHDDLTSGGDVDLVRTSCKMKLGFGVFQKLRLIHLIPPTRLEESYLLRLIRGIAKSRYLVQYANEGVLRLPSWTRLDQLIHLLRVLDLDGRRRRFYLAQFNGRKEAIVLVEKMKAEKSGRPVS